MSHNGAIQRFHAILTRSRRHTDGPTTPNSMAGRPASAVVQRGASMGAHKERKRPARSRRLGSAPQSMALRGIARIQNAPRPRHSTAIASKPAGTSKPTVRKRTWRHGTLFCSVFGLGAAHLCSIVSRARRPRGASFNSAQASRTMLTMISTSDSASSTVTE